MNRRDFLRITSRTAAVAIAVPSLLSNNGKEPLLLPEKSYTNTMQTFSESYHVENDFISNMSFELKPQSGDELFYVEKKE